MYHPTRKCGVLTDFDLTAMAWLTRVPGTDRIGTIPFMAMELLQDQYWEDNITGYYHHELEAFIWMLPFVFLAYNNGKFDPQTRFIEDWITSDFNTCGRKKFSFATDKLATALHLVKVAFQDYEALMVEACIIILNLYVRRRQALALRAIKRPERPLNDGNVSPQVALYIQNSVAMWDAFIAIFSTLDIDVTRVRMHRPVFENSGNQDLCKELKAICDTSRLLARRRAS